MKDETNSPKVLLISHNSFSLVSNNGKTYSSIFTGWPKDRIAQLYFQNEIPDFSVCNNFFYITDESMLLGNKETIGKRVLKDNTTKIKTTNSPIHTYARNKPLPIFTTMRNIIWSFEKWDNKNLSSWIEEFSPEVVFFVGGGATFSYKIANKISNKYSIPIYLYYTDDYITPALTLDFFWWINLISLKKALTKTLANVSNVFVIGDDMASEYTRLLGKQCIPIMNAVDIDRYSLAHDKYKKDDDCDDNLKIAYFGGLHLNRWKTLAKLGESIKKLSNKITTDISVSIYTVTKPDGFIMDAISIFPYMQYAGSVNENKMIEEMNKYDVLLHIESFDRGMKHKTRLSVSTKIPEYLASGKPILAIGPDDISSIRYLKKLGISYVIELLDETNINDELLKIISEKHIHADIGLKGIMVAKENHSVEKNRTLIKDTLSKISKLD